ncbi:MAG: hypothetical protein A2Y94_06700 [Caldithrix sp. RBG_13_44_9]|nr:MAG: hypothetical protein A2Y94_06700 [Caldithrix sp. RBG_13_44_9]
MLKLQKSFLLSRFSAFKYTPKSAGKKSDFKMPDFQIALKKVSLMILKRMRKQFLDQQYC